MAASDGVAADSIAEDVPSAASIRELLRSTALDRARVLTPFVLLGMVISLIVSESVGISLSWPVLIYNAIAIGALVVLGIALLTRRIATRWGHAVAYTVALLPITATLVAQYVSRDANLHIVLMLEIGVAAIQLHTRYVVSALVVTLVLGAPLLVRDSGAAAGVYISALIGAAIYALLGHIVLQRSLIRAEVHRAAQAATAHELAQRLAELEDAGRERERLQDQLLHAQRMEAVGTLAAGLAHDMNNVLAAITSFAGVLVDDTAAPRARADLEQIIAQAERGAGLTRGLLAFSRRGQYRTSVVALDQVLSEVIPRLARTLPKSIAIHQALAPASPASGGALNVDADPVQLEQILVNFGLNAADAMAGTGTLSIELAAVELAASRSYAVGVPAGTYARMRVRDTGSGMDEATRRRVFEPFFTTKGHGKGTGLGLSSVWGIVKAHGGAVEVESTVGAGTTFDVYLPTTTAPLALRPTPPAPAVTLRRGRVLVVDDEPAVRAGTQRILEKMGLDTLAACNGAEALTLFAREGPTIGLVILDMGMPVLGGAECFDRLRQTSPVPVLISTGYAVDLEAQRLVARGASLIEKPFRAQDLTREVAHLLDLER